MPLLNITPQEEETEDIVKKTIAELGKGEEVQLLHELLTQRHIDGKYGRNHEKNRCDHTERKIQMLTGW